MPSSQSSRSQCPSDTSQAFSPADLLYDHPATVNGFASDGWRSFDFFSTTPQNPPGEIVRMLLKQSFFRRDALEVARDVIGAELVRGPVRLRVTEVEAYRRDGDTANHCRFGLTTRNAAMFGPPGHAYVYLCYGLHWMLNLVTDETGIGAAVLVRSAEVVDGLPLVMNRRLAKARSASDRPRERPLGERALAELTAGPGKVGQALGLDATINHHALFRRGALELHAALGPAPSLIVGPRVGIDYADPEHRFAPWRIAAADSACVTARKLLNPPIP